MTENMRNFDAEQEVQGRTEARREFRSRAVLDVSPRTSPAAI